jgi:hypothetical protein
MNYVFSRVIWVIIFIASTALFVYLVATKIQLLVKKDNKIDIKVNYPVQLSFPAVTICNQNKYRYVVKVSV